MPVPLQQAGFKVHRDADAVQVEARNNALSTQLLGIFTTCHEAVDCIEHPIARHRCDTVGFDSVQQQAHAAVGLPATDPKR